MTADGDEQVTAASFLRRLEALRSDEQLAKYRRAFPGRADHDQFIGVPMGAVFSLAKQSIAMAPDEIERLLRSPIHEARAGALSIMDKQARHRSTSPERRKELYELYLRELERIDDWDLVDLAAPYVVGGYLGDKPRDILYDLARSENVWSRRTAIVASGYFIRQGDVGDTFAIAGLLVGDPHQAIHKATGWMLRETGKVDPAELKRFLDRHAAAMPRVMLRYAIEHLDPATRTRYLGRNDRPPRVSPRARHRTSDSTQT